LRLDFKVDLDWNGSKWNKMLMCQFLDMVEKNLTADLRCVYTQIYFRTETERLRLVSIRLFNTARKKSTFIHAWWLLLSGNGMTQDSSVA